MEQKYIDKLFKSKLENREVAFSEDAWFAAEKMIQQEEQRRRWGGFGRFLYLLPLLIGGLLLFVYNLPPLDVPANQSSMTTLSTPAASQSDLEASSFNESEIETTDNTLNTNIATTNSESEMEESVVSLVTTIDNTLENNTTTTQAIDLDNSTEKVEKATIQQITNPISIPSDAPVKINSTSKKAIEKPQALQLPVVQEEVDILAPIALNETVISGVETKGKLIESSGEMSDFKLNKAYAALDMEAVDFTFETSPPALKKENLINYKPRNFRLGLMSAAILTPSFNDQVIGLSGANFGGTFAWLFNERWSLNTDLLYEFHGRNYAFPNGNNTLSVNYQTYSFGVNDNFLNVKVKQSHLITLPVYFKYNMGRHSVSLGAQMAYTIGLRGEIEEEVVAPVESASIRVDKDSWLESDKVSPIQFNIMTGYQFALTKQLSLGLRTVIVPSRLPRQGNDDDNAFNALELLGIGGDNIEGEKTPIPIFEHNAVNFHVNIQYTLNSKTRHITKPLLGL